MNCRQASEILRKHNRWRRQGGAFNPNPRVIGEAIDVAPDVLALAPGLLEACEQARVYVESDEATHGRKFAVGNEIRAAIAKAKRMPPNA